MSERPPEVRLAAPARQPGSTMFQRDRPPARRPVSELLLLGFVPPLLALLFLARAVLGTRAGRAAMALLVVGLPLALLASSRQAVRPLVSPPAASAGSGAGAVAVAVAPVPSSSSAGGGGALVPLESRLIVELLNGRTARLAGSGMWVDPGIPMSRVRLQRGSPGAAGRLTPAEAAEVVRRLLVTEYRTVDLMGTAPATAWRLGPEEAGTSAAGGVTAPSDPILGQSPVWVVTARGEGRPTREAIQVAGALPAMLEVLLVDARTGDLLVRPPRMEFAAADAMLRRDGPSPSNDATRPLGFFGDPAP